MQTDNGAANDMIVVGEEAPVPDAAPATPLPAPPSAAQPTAENVGSEAQFTPESAQGAARVVEAYYALIEAKNYVEAHKLWGPASDLADETFAAKFAGYREYQAEVDAPGRVEGAAGSLYVTVPVRTHRVTTKGEQFNVPAVVTLRRANNVDGSTAEQRRWHITEIDEPLPPH